MIRDQIWDHSEPLDRAIDLIKFAGPYHNYPGSGGVWCGENGNLPDGNFTDWALGRAMAQIAQAVYDGELTRGEPD